MPSLSYFVPYKNIWLYGTGLLSVPAYEITKIRSAGIRSHLYLARWKKFICICAVETVEIYSNICCRFLENNKNHCTGIRSLIFKPIQNFEFNRKVTFVTFRRQANRDGLAEGLGHTIQMDGSERVNYVPAATGSKTSEQKMSGHWDPAYVYDATATRILEDISLPPSPFYTSDEH